jgi:hypothetical protein
VLHGAEAEVRGGAFEGCVRSRGEEPHITHRTVAVGFGLGVLLIFDFNGDKFMCVIFWVHNGWRLLAVDVLLGGDLI